MTGTGQALPRFERSVRIRFGHCDPAGIVFFPRYYELFNALVEDWVNEGLGLSYAELLGPRRVGLPTVAQRTEFLAPSFMGDEVHMGLDLLRLGRSAFDLRLSCRCKEQWRVKMHTTLVCTNLLSHKAMPLPEDLRAAMLAWPQPQPGLDP
jgi:4-hydroxybenzoyl-CoA thioesterase